MRYNVGTTWDRPEHAEKGKTPTGEFRVYNVFVPEADGDPQAYLVRSFSEHATVGSHFHEHPQFQVFVEGDGTFQRHAVAPINVHFTDAYSVYGPIIAGDDGLSFFVLRPELDAGARYMPGSREQLIRRGRRNLSVTIDRDQLAADGRVKLFDDDDGLLGEAHQLAPGQMVTLPDVSTSPGCYTMILAGTCEIVGTDVSDAGVNTIVHRVAGDGSTSVAAGPDGATLLSLRFPTEPEGE